MSATTILATTLNTNLQCESPWQHQCVKTGAHAVTSSLLLLLALLVLRALPPADLRVETRSVVRRTVSADLQLLHLTFASSFSP